jgi:hypothetical protein
MCSVLSTHPPPETLNARQPTVGIPEGFVPKSARQSLTQRHIRNACSLRIKKSQLHNGSPNVAMFLVTVFVFPLQPKASTGQVVPSCWSRPNFTSSSITSKISPAYRRQTKGDSELYTEAYRMGRRVTTVETTGKYAYLSKHCSLFGT